MFHKGNINKILLSASLLLLGGASIHAQAPEGPQGGSPTQSTPAPQQQAPQQQPPEKKPEQSGVSISVEVPVVTLDVVAATEHGDIIPGLKKENFRILEDGAPQTISNFGPSDAPITMVMLLEYSARYGGFFSYYAKYWSGYLFPNLGKQDWVALETFDMKPRIEVDFTQDKNELMQGVNHLFYPGFSESNLFDAILDTVERLKDVKGKKSIVVMASGVDTFSKHTLDQTMKLLHQTDVSIFCVGLGRVFQNYADMRGGMRGTTRMDYLQGENQLKTFARMTGGMSWFPQFEGEMPGDFQSLVAFLRHQYSVTYTPSNAATDGKFRKIKVELVAPDGGPLTVTDQKGKKQKVIVYAREGYTAPKGGVGD